MTVRLIQGDVRDRLAELPDGSVQTCVTSPPYYGLRDYGTADWQGGNPDCDHRKPSSAEGSTLQGGKKTTGHQQEGFGRECRKCGAVRVDRQIGLEPTLAEYVASLVQVFREVRRVLRDDGTLWLNLGSSYASAIIESEEYVMRDDLTDQERAYVYAELAKHFQTLSGVRGTDAPAEQDVPTLLSASERPSRQLRRAGV